ncbi:MAG: hypothetical protein A4S09_06815 [Proteobacteria bacterium SG_bin7]|nr:MAG: hypothetical protein A4S09_06815 [Proteobacteria bacterium SG_bin7]
MVIFNFSKITSTFDRKAGSVHFVHVDVRTQNKSLFSVFVEVLIFGSIYFLAAKFGLSFSPVGGVATAIWPPTGIALAAVFIYGYHLLVAIAVGAFAINLLATGSLLAAFGISIGNTLETFTAVYFLRRVGFDHRMIRYRDVISLVGIAALGSTLISALIGVLTSWSLGIISSHDMVSAFLTWWGGDALADLVISPLLLMAWRPKEKFKFNFHKLMEESLVYIVIIVLSILLQMELTGFEFYFRPQILYPVLLWAAFRLPQRGIHTAILLISFIMSWGTALDRGPFSGTESHVEDFFILQIYLATIAITFLFVGALITQWRKAENDLHRALADRDDFLAIVSHDLKNPISTILLNAQLLKLTLDKNEFPRNLRRQVEIFMRAGNQMKNLVENLLDAAKVESGTFFLELRLVNAKSIIDECFEMFRQQAAEKGIKLISQIENIDYQVYCDHYRTMQVLSNLVDNALKFTPSGGTICVYVKEVDRIAHFCIEDSGPGIPEDELPHIFDRYWQGKRVGKSSVGLGLAIAKGIIDAHGGRIWVSNREVDQGARFYFTLPLAEDSYDVISSAATRDLDFF